MRGRRRRSRGRRAMCCFQSSVALSVHVWVACLDAYAYPKTQVEDTRHFVQQDIHVYVYEFPKTRVKDTKTNRGQGFSKTREGMKLLASGATPGTEAVVEFDVERWGSEALYTS